MSTENVTVNFTPPDGKGEAASVSYTQGGNPWKATAVAWNSEQSYSLQQGWVSSDMGGWQIWGISFWGVGNDPAGEPKVIKTPVARLIQPQDGSGAYNESASFAIDDTPYSYVTSISFGNNGNFYYNFTINNKNTNEAEGQGGYVCFQLIFTNYKEY